MSNPGTPGSRHLSREPSPFDQAIYGQSEHHHQKSPEPSSGHQRTDSMSRSVSPFAQQYISPSITGNPQRAGSLPAYNKPQSPPALIIPSHPSPSPSPALPPLVTTTAAPGGNNARSGVQLPARNGNTSGGLLPPANPALEHLTGMAGISPIGPSTDGPMIYIQPSTPISGLKEGRGVFDAAIRRGMGQQAQQGSTAQMQGQQDGQQQDDFNVPPPASHPLSRNSSGNHYSQQNNQGGNAVQQNPNFSTSMQISGTHVWSQSGDAQWGDLRPSGQMRPRAKSDSYMGASANDLFDRQMLLAMAGGQGNTNLEHAALGESANDFRSNIDTWRAALIGGEGQNQQAPVPTLDPRNLPGNQDENASPDFLQQLQMSQQYSQLQAQRDRLPSLNTNAQTSGSGIFKYEPGEFSPTSLAFYQQLGINPASASQLAGTSSAPFFQTNFQNIPQNNWPHTAGPAAQSFLNPEQPGLGPRRRSFAEGTNHPAAGAGTPGYGMEFTSPLGPPGLRATSPVMGHRRGVQSEDIGRGGNGWGMAGAGSTFVFPSLALDMADCSTALTSSIPSLRMMEASSHLLGDGPTPTRVIPPHLQLAPFPQHGPYRHKAPRTGSNRRGWT